MKVSKVMSRTVITVAPSATFRDMWKKFVKNKIHALPVVDKKKKLLGIVSRENLLECLYPDYKDLFANAEEFPDLEEMEENMYESSSLRAERVMTKQVIYTKESVPVLRALSRMIVRRVNQLPVLSSHGQLVGMVTKGDIFYSLFQKHTKRGTKRKK